MKFSFFEALTDQQANAYLNEFLEFGQNRGLVILNENLNSTVALDFTLESLPVIIKELIPLLKTIPRELDSSVPEFIRNTESYVKNLFDFDDRSMSIALAAAFYMGASFVESFENLSWAIGRSNRAEQQQPVVTGFKADKDMPVILISENIFRGVIAGMREVGSIDKAISAWKNNV